jgi:hypothetical protein
VAATAAVATTVKKRARTVVNPDLDPDPAADATNATEAAATFFCMHPVTMASPAGAMCRDCGVVVSDSNCTVERGIQAPIMVHAVEPDPSLVGGTGSAAEIAAHLEWERHAAALSDQPVEVLQEARQIFVRVYIQQGAHGRRRRQQQPTLPIFFPSLPPPPGAPLLGIKARALVRVALLHCVRKLYGTDRPNEERLIGRFPVPARALNKAFHQMAAVTLLPKRKSSAVDGDA